MDFELPEEIRVLRDAVRRFTDEELIPREPDAPEGEDFPQAYMGPLQDKVKALGLWQLDVPREYGGLGLVVIDYLQLMSAADSTNENRATEISEISRSLKAM